MTTIANNLSWKKIIIIGAFILVVSLLIHEILFWTFFHETQQMLSQLNSQIVQQQKDIQKKLADSDKEFKERGKKMDEQSNQFGEIVKNAQENIGNYLEHVEQEQASLQKSFDKSFKEAPAKMWAAHEKFGEKMRNDYIKESKQMNKDFNNQLSRNK
ncbi:MAG: hypothetical protein ACYCQI_12425 [Gammaproteobacteria bacterium]